MPPPHSKTTSRRSLFGTYNNIVCSLTADTYPAIWDEELQMYYFPDLKARLENNNETEAIATADDMQGIIDEILSELAPGQRYELVRLCWCTQYAQLPYEFCPAQFDTCEVTPGVSATTATESSTPVTCYSSHPRDTIIRSFWPVLLFWTAAVVYAWLFTTYGKTARGYLVRRLLCCCSYGGSGTTSAATESSTTTNNNSNNNNTTTALRQLDVLLRSEPDRASFMYQQYLHRSRLERERRRARQNTWWYRHLLAFTGTPIEINGNGDDDNASLSDETKFKLTLKTKIFHETDIDVAERQTTDAASGRLHDGAVPDDENENVDDDDDDALSTMSRGDHCVICLLRLEEGDVIGDIPCGHLLHKDCLKDWVRRKNKCPLCQHSGIATLSLERVKATTTSSA
jgi:Ring finger domain